MSSNPKKQPALGRGLSALLQNSETDITSMNGATVGSVSMINIQHIEANPFNPRTHFEKEALEELRMSILTHGIIQPLTVRKLGRDRYQLISGERRFRASQLAGLTEVPAYIRIANDQTMLEMALVENIQREDLNAIEVAISYERLLDECKLTQEQLSEKVAKSRSSIANHIRLLKLPASIQAGVRDQKISMGHARALLSITDEQEQLNAYQQIIDEALSVRAVELMVKPASNNGQTTTKKPKIGLSNTEQVFTAFLSDKLGAKVSIDKTDSGKGKVQVHFSTEAELNRVMALLKK
ncbi:MAG: ParB/RepB/Spo0J family partition protein [Crocinitomicaceae bacterium]|jgi:ParB family transcriptional regulator, chromosome partitioning protein|nr:ParB/RepB/Spo0J family partition protein [Crocinitomicaceae bacterium]MDP4760411.1 ParB/RepB/Spo0J family partition protein [Crocinitomicaceae bacterium]